jgi:hypothetical protein
MSLVPPTDGVLADKRLSKSGSELSSGFSFRNLRRLTSRNSLSGSRMDSLSQSIANIIHSQSDVIEETPDVMNGNYGIIFTFRFSLLL